MASRWVWFIFQLPLISGLRSTATARRRLPQSDKPREVSLLYELEGGASAGREVVDLVVQAEQLEGAGAVTPTHHREALRGSHGVGHCPRARCEAGVLEDPHRAVPKHGGGRDDLVGKRGGRTGPDVEAEPPVRDVGADQADFTFGFLARTEDPSRGQGNDVAGQQDLL